MGEHRSAGDPPGATDTNLGFVANLRQDASASLVVFFVAVPLCLGIALASGAPLFSGLVAGIVGGIVVGLISRSPLGVSGPAAGLAVIVLTAINDLGDFRTFLLAVVLAGIVQILMGVARAGILAYFFPSAVIKGMLAGIGILIILKQIPHAFGYDSSPEGELAFSQSDGENTVSALLQAFTHTEPVAIALAALSLFILILWESVLGPRHKLFRLVQGPLIVVAIGVVYQAITSRFATDLALSGDHLVQVPVASGFSGFLDLFTTPDWTQLTNGAVYVTAITIAVVASLETLLCVEATDRLDPLKRVTPTNRELVAQGVGNTVSGCIGGLPITQVIVRSSANIQSGGRTKTSAILHGVLLLAFTATLPFVLNMIPLAVLAAILLTVGFKLTKPSVIRQVYSMGASQFLPFAVTVVGIVMTDLLMGIGLGMGVALFGILLRNYRNSHFLHKEEEDQPDGRHVVRMRFSEEVSFLNRGAILRELSSLPDKSHVLLDTRNCVIMSADVAEIIDDFKISADRRSITVEVISGDRPRSPLSMAR